MHPSGHPPFIHPQQMYMQQQRPQSGGSIPQQQQFTGSVPGLAQPYPYSGSRLPSAPQPQSRPYPGSGDRGPAPQHVPTLGPAASRAGTAQMRGPVRGMMPGSGGPGMAGSQYSGPSQDMVTLLSQGIVGGMSGIGGPGGMGPIGGGMGGDGSGRDAVPFDVSDFPALGSARGGDSVHRPPSASDQMSLMHGGVDDVFKRQEGKGFSGRGTPTAPFSLPSQSGSGAPQAAVGTAQGQPGATQSSLQSSQQPQSAQSHQSQQFVYTPQAVHVAPQPPGPGAAYRMGMGQDPFARSGTPMGDLGAGAAAAAAAAAQGGGGFSSPTLGGVDVGAERYGMMGLLSVVRMTNADLNLLALGTDLTVLGLNLGSTEPLYSGFVSPFSEAPSKREPEFKLPGCYVFTASPSLDTAVQKMAHFTEETLFYIFYCLPGDAMQVTAANELLRREWRYHRELRAWFLPVPGTELQKTPQYERGSYYHFDVTSWSRTRKDNVMLATEALEQAPLGNKA